MINTLPNTKVSWLLNEVPAIEEPNNGVWLFENIPELVELKKLVVLANEVAWLLDDTPKLGEVEKLTVLTGGGDLVSKDTPELHDVTGEALALCERAWVFADKPKLHEGDELVELRIEVEVEVEVELEAPEFDKGMKPVLSLLPNTYVPGPDFTSLLFVCRVFFFSLYWVPNKDVLPSLPFFAFSQLTTSVNFPC